MFLLKSNLNEAMEAQVTRFLNGLNQDIQEVVELHEHGTLQDINIFHQAIKVEK